MIRDITKQTLSSLNETVGQKESFLTVIVDQLKELIDNLYETSTMIVRDRIFRSQKVPK